MNIACKNKLGLFYFSGTNNTAVVTELLAKAFSDTFDVDIYKIDNNLFSKMDSIMSRYEIIGIGFPIYGFNAPRIIKDFCMSENLEKKRIILYSTCAGPCYLNLIASFGIKLQLKRKENQIIYEEVICMPANILIQYDDDLIVRLYNKAESITAKMANDVNDKFIQTRNDSILPRMIRPILIPLDELSLRLVPIDFKVTSQCVQCGICINQCPRSNIVLTQDRVKHLFNCEACYKCVYECPQSAIKGRLYNKAIFKKGYSIEKDLKRLENYTPHKKLKGIFKSFEKYLRD